MNTKQAYGVDELQAQNFLIDLLRDIFLGIMSYIIVIIHLEKQN